MASYAVVGAALSVPLPGAPLTFISDSTALSLSRSPRALASYAVVGAALSVPLPGVALTNARSPPNSNFNHLNLTNKNPFSASNEKKVVVVIVAVILLLFGSDVVAAVVAVTVAFVDGAVVVQDHKILFKIYSRL